MNPENTGAMPVGSQIMLLQIDTLHCQWKEPEYKAEKGKYMIQCMCTEHTVVGKKARL